MRDFAHWVFIHAVTTKEKNLATTKIPEWKELKLDGADIEFKIAGVEVDFLEVMDALDKQVDRMILEEARKLIQENFANMNNYLFELEKTAKSAITHTAEEMNIQLSETYDYGN